MHQNPELSYEEHATSAFLKKVLTEIGIPFEGDWADTGIVATIEGLKPEKKTIALRADIDALPIKEENTLSYTSKNEGVMHACGHDVHSSCLLGAAAIMYQLRDSFEGTIKLIFQPAEEKLPGGASLLLGEGLFDKHPSSAIIGQHVMPDLDAGKIGFRPGPYMASADELYFTVKGKGGHAALPHKLVDPVLISAHLITALQQLVSRRNNTTTPCVLSIGKLHANGATNVIPNEVKMEGTFRTFDENWRFEAHELIQRLASELCSSMGGSCDVDIKVGYPAVLNDETLTAESRQHAADYMGEENIVELDLRMTAEDFAYYGREIPGCFYRLGTGNEKKGITSSLHTPTFNVDEESLKHGAGLMAYLALKTLGN